MTHTIMFVPASINTELETNIVNVEQLLTKRNLRTAVWPKLDIETIEQYLASNRIEDLLEIMAKQQATIGNKKDVILIPGVPLIKPYATELNLYIALSLGAALIFVTNVETNTEHALRQLKIILNPYQHRYQRPLLGFIINNNKAINVAMIEQQKKSIGLDLPLIGVFPTNQETIKISEQHGDDGFDFSSIQKYLDTTFVPTITPPTFKYRLIEKARNANKKIVFPEGDEPRTLTAVDICQERGIAQCILLGEKNKIYAVCDQLNLKLHNKIKIIEPQTVREKYINPLYELRRTKGMTLAEAKKQLEDNVVLGTMMLHFGEVDGLISGAIHTTANTIRPAFQIIKTPPNVKLVSSVFFMCLPDQVLVYGDCAINPNPNSEELADIAIQSANSAAAFGITPRIAMLSYSTGTSGSGPSVNKVRDATTIVRKMRPDLEIEGPIQYDAAISEETARIKAPQSKTAGHATVFIMPNLDVGNTIYKAVQRSTGIVCVGPMLQGLRKPVNDLSRGCTINDIVFTVAVTAVQAINSYI